MAKALTVVGLGGSLAKISKSRAALQTALEGAATAGAETQLLDIRELDLPMYNPDADEPTESASRLIEMSYAADGMLWSSPMYQGTISGAFKNALDWLHVLGQRDPPYLHDKVIGLISAAGGTQGLQAINTMEFSVPCRTSSRSQRRRACSIRPARFRIKLSSCSSRRLAARSCGSPSGSSLTRRRTATRNVLAQPNGSRQSRSHALAVNRGSP